MGEHMGRIRDAYETKFRTLLQRVQPRRLELGVQLLLEHLDLLRPAGSAARQVLFGPVNDRAGQVETPRDDQSARLTRVANAQVKGWSQRFCIEFHGSIFGARVR